MMMMYLIYDDGTTGGTAFVDSPRLRRGEIRFSYITLDAKKGTIVGVGVKDGDWKSEAPLDRVTLKHGGTYTVTDLTLRILPEHLDRSLITNTEPKLSRMGHARKVITG